MVVAHRLEGRESARKVWSSMITMHGVDDASQHLWLGGAFRCDARASDEARDKDFFRPGGDEVHNLSSDAHLCGNSGAGAFALPVDTEQVRALAADAEHEGLCSDVDTVILVRDTASEWRDDGLGTVPFRDLAQNTLKLLIHEWPFLVFAKGFSMSIHCGWDGVKL